MLWKPTDYRVKKVTSYRVCQGKIHCISSMVLIEMLITSWGKVVLLDYYSLKPINCRQLIWISNISIVFSAPLRKPESNLEIPTCWENYKTGYKKRDSAPESHKSFLSTSAMNFTAVMALVLAGSGLATPQCKISYQKCLSSLTRTSLYSTTTRRFRSRVSEVYPGFSGPSGTFRSTPASTARWISRS